MLRLLQAVIDYFAVDFVSSFVFVDFLWEWLYLLLNRCLLYVLCECHAFQ